MASKYIVHGTQFFSKEVQLTVNAPNEEEAIIKAEEITKGAGTRMRASTASFAEDLVEKIGDELNKPWTDT